MRTRIFTMLVLCMLLCACQKKMELLHPLAFSTERVEMPAEGAYHIAAVYSERPWTAEFENVVDWISADCLSGEAGISRIRLECGANTGLKRTARLVVRSGENIDILEISQFSGQTNPKMFFTQSEIELPSDPTEVCITLNTNIPGALKDAEISACDAKGEPVSWLTNLYGENGKVYFKLLRASERREAFVKVKIEDVSEGILLESTVKVIQNPL